MKKITIKITSKVIIKGLTYKIELHVENVAKKADSNRLTYMSWVKNTLLMFVCNLVEV